MKSPEETSTPSQDERREGPVVAQLQAVVRDNWNSKKPAGALLRITVFLKNAHFFDFMTEKDVSIARYFMRKFGDYRQGYEDFMMASELHSAWKAPMSWLLRN